MRSVESTKKESCHTRPSRLRAAYLARLAGRCIVLVLCAAAAVKRPEMLGVLDGWAFFREFSPLHVLWAVWMADMALQLVPVRQGVPLGSQKLFRQRFRPADKPVDKPALNRYITAVTKRAGHILVLWTALVALIGVLLHRDVINRAVVFLLSVFFYVCDLICVLIWCPFRLYLGNRCCTTCRIFNWDHLMMFSPLIWLGGFFSLSLVAGAVIVWIAWEGSVFRHPERFWEKSNRALQCTQCTDKLCTQYCRKRK